MTASHAPVDTTPRPESRGRDRPWAALGSALAAARPPRMNWSAAAYARWRAQDHHLPRGDGGGLNPAHINPPLYYLYEVPAYRLGEHADLFTRLQLTRIDSVLWLLVTVVAVWLL